LEDRRREREEDITIGKSGLGSGNHSFFHLPMLSKAYPALNEIYISKSEGCQPLYIVFVLTNRRAIDQNVK
jgi:hypothetical protein